MVRRAGFEPARGRVLNPPPLPIGLSARARGGLRTCTLPEFKAGPLTVGLHEHGAPGGIRTRHCPGSKPSASYQLGLPVRSTVEWSRQRASNPRPFPYQGRALLAEL